jgi:hypothetical protein
MSLSRTTLLFTLLAAAPALHASSITYDVMLSPTSGPYGGSGTITLASAPASSGITTYSQAAGSLQGLTFTVGNQTFSLAGDPSATVEFLNGQLYNISFAQTVGSSPNRFTLDTSAVYAFYYNDGQAESAGSLTAIPAIDSGDPASTQPTTSPTPEPGTLLLVATALAGGAFFVFRRKRTAHS